MMARNTENDHGDARGTVLSAETLRDEPIRVRTTRVTGLRRTRDYVVRDELTDISNAQTFGSLLRAVDDATAALRSLDVFDSVSATIRRADSQEESRSDQGVVFSDVEILLRERKSPTALKIGASTSNGDDAAVEASFATRGVLGHGEVLRLSYSSGRRKATDVHASLSKRRVLGRPIEATISVADGRGEAPWAPSTALFRGRDARTESAHVTLRDPNASLDLAVARREGSLSSISDAEIGSGNDESTTKYSATFERTFFESRDSRSAPTIGGTAGALLEVAGGSILGDAHYVKASGAAQRHWRLFAVPAPNGFVALGLNARAGVLIPESGRSVPRPDRFYLGGPLDFRGFDRAGVGPRGPPGGATPDTVSSSSSSSWVVNRLFGDSSFVKRWWHRPGTKDSHKREETQTASENTKDKEQSEDMKPLSGVAAGGLAFATATAMVSAPLVFKPDEPNADRLRGHVFCTAGVLVPPRQSSESVDTHQRLLDGVRASAGVGVSFSPHDLIRLELNYATYVKACPSDLTKRFHFGITGGFG